MKIFFTLSDEIDPFPDSTGLAYCMKTSHLPESDFSKKNLILAKLKEDFDRSNITIAEVSDGES